MRDRLIELMNRVKYKIAYAIYPQYFDDMEYRLSRLLSHATGGQLSKTNYPAQVMETAVTDYLNECCNECEYYLAYEEAKAENALKERERG